MSRAMWAHHCAIANELSWIGAGEPCPWCGLAHVEHDFSEGAVNDLAETLARDKWICDLDNPAACEAALTRAERSGWTDQELTAARERAAVLRKRYAMGERHIASLYEGEHKAQWAVAAILAAGAPLTLISGHARAADALQSTGAGDWFYTSLFVIAIALGVMGIFLKEPRA